MQPTQEPVDFTNFSIEILSQYIAMKDWQKTWSYIHQFISSLTARMNHSASARFQKDVINHQDGLNYAHELGELLGQFIFALIINPDVPIPDEEFNHLVYNSQTIHDLFIQKGLNPDPAIEELLQKHKKPSPGVQKKILLLLGLNTQLDIVKILKKTDTKYRVITVSSLIGGNAVYTKRAYENKIRLYELRQDLEKMGANSYLLSTLISPYFNCSYMNHAEKHDVKKNINRSVQGYITRHQKRIDEICQVSVAIENKTDKPRALVYMEYFNDGHAMVRSYGAWIKSLEKEFDVVIITDIQFKDDPTNELFPQVVFYSNFIELISLSHIQKPDIMIFPSIGMKSFSIIISNIRIAPIQMMALGHPATTHSPHIDYVYGQSALYDERAFPNDVFIADDSPYQFRPHFQLQEILKQPIYSRQKGDTAPLKVSVIGSEAKIIYPFLELLRQIESESDFAIDFSFYVGAMSYDSLYMKQVILGNFKSCRYVGLQPFPKYMQSIADSDIILNPFPFGHTNTIIDTLVLGKPCVGLEGVEPASRTEKYILETVGLEDMFLAKDEQDYKDKFQGLAKRILAGETEFFDRHKVYETLYAEKPDVDFAKNVKWIFDNHDRMKKLGRKKYDLFEDLEG